MATPAFVQQVAIAASSSGNTGLTATLGAGINTTTGNTLLAFVKTSGSINPTGVSDSRGNTWTLDYSLTVVTSRMFVYRSTNATALVVGDTISGAWASSAGTNLYIWEFSGLAASSPVDVSVNNPSIATVTTLSSGATASTTATNDLVISYVETGSAKTTYTAPGGSYNQLSPGTTPMNINIAYYIEPTITTIASTTWSWSVASNANVGIITYKAATGTPAVNSNFFAFM